MTTNAEAVSHTPGPWKYDGSVQIHEAARPHMRIAFLPSDWRDYASSKPNARLIAAAPELLRLLRWCVDTLRARNPEVLGMHPEGSEAATLLAKLGR